MTSSLTAFASESRRFEKLERAARAAFASSPAREVNILPDGSLDYDDELLGDLDWVIASVHTSFRISKKAMTERVLAAIDHPLVDCIGHLSGRLIGRRDPYEIDVERVVAEAARTGTMLEINGNPEPTGPLRAPRPAGRGGGCTICVNTDAHRVGDAEQHGLRHRDGAPCLAHGRPGCEHKALAGVLEAAQAHAGGQQLVC